MDNSSVGLLGSLVGPGSPKTPGIIGTPAMASPAQQLPPQSVVPIRSLLNRNAHTGHVCFFFLFFGWFFFFCAFFALHLGGLLLYS